MITGLFHAALKTNDLAASLAFYTQLLGLRQAARPDPGHSGAWLAVPLAGRPSILHIYADGPILGLDRRAPLGSAAIDHLSLTASGYHAFLDRIEAAGLPWRGMQTANSQLWHLFVYDPNGVLIELVFDGRAEAGPTPVLTEATRLQPGRGFFDAISYPKLAKAAPRPPHEAG
jgi:catechol 2,3-dioxygenase-like lactoylglutathione lyase family enzyme